MNAAKSTSSRWGNLSTGQRTFVRYISLFLNILVLIVGVGTICMACYVYTKMAPEAIAAYALLVPLKEMFTVGIILGSTLVLFSVLGTAGVFLKLKVLLILYAVVVFVCLIGHISIASMSYAQYLMRSDGKVTGKVVMGDAWSSLNDTGRITVQNGLDCCGFENPSDRFGATPICLAAAIPGSPIVKKGCMDVALATIVPSSTVIYTVLFSVSVVELFACVFCMIVIAFPDRCKPSVQTDNSLSLSHCSKPRSAENITPDRTTSKPVASPTSRRVAN